MTTAREVGEMFLADGNIPGAWPYFRAVGDTEPIVKALDTFDVDESDTPDSQERWATRFRSRSRKA